MKTVEINLTFRRSDFEELYFRNGNEKLFFSPSAKKLTYFFIFSGLLFLSSILHFVITNKSQESVLFLGVIWILSSIFLCSQISILFKWKKSVVTFLDKTSEHKVYRVILSDNSFGLIQDNEESMEKWSEFKKVEIDEESIKMYSETYYLFPSKSMMKEEYEMFKEIVREKIKNGL